MTSPKVKPCTDFEKMRPLLIEYEGFIANQLSLDFIDYDLIERVRHYDARFIATIEGKLAGCVALRRFDEHICEIKHLYVKPHLRRFGVGRALIEAAIVEAERRRFAAVRLDTLPAMKSAQALYAAFGFRDIAPYHNDLAIEGVRYMELQLGDPRQSPNDPPDASREKSDGHFRWLASFRGC